MQSAAGGGRQTHRRDLSDRDIGTAAAAGKEEEEGRGLIIPIDKCRHVPIFNERRKQHDNVAAGVQVHLRPLFVILLIIFGCSSLRLGSVWSGITPGQHMHFTIVF